MLCTAQTDANIKAKKMQKNVGNNHFSMCKSSSLFAAYAWTLLCKCNKIKVVESHTTVTQIKLFDLKEKPRDFCLFLSCTVGSSGEDSHVSRTANWWRVYSVNHFHDCAHLPARSAALSLNICRTYPCLHTAPISYKVCVVFTAVPGWTLDPCQSNYL